MALGSGPYSPLHSIVATRGPVQPQHLFHLMAPTMGLRQTSSPQQQGLHKTRAPHPLTLDVVCVLRCLSSLFFSLELLAHATSKVGP
jgi:hypothetical protein